MKPIQAIQKNFNSSRQRSALTDVLQEQPSCPCPRFLQMSVESRSASIRYKQLCLNCFTRGNNNRLSPRVHSVASPVTGGNVRCIASDKITRMRVPKLNPHSPLPARAKPASKSASPKGRTTTSTPKGIDLPSSSSKTRGIYIKCILFFINCYHGILILHCLNVITI